MGVKGLLQPSGSTVVTLRSSWTGETLSLTLDELMAMGQELVPDCNTLLMTSYSTAYGYLFRLNHIDDITDLYLRNDLVSGVDNCIAYDQSINLSGSNVLYGSKFHISDGIEAQSVAWNLSTRNYEGKNYSYDSNSNESLPPYIIYTTAKYKNLYINGSLVDKNTGGGAGSGYIGNSLLSNKKMVGYNAPTSSAESTKTESVEDAKSKTTSGKPKIGNGYARITLLQEITPNPPEEFLQDIDAINGSGYVFKNWQQPASLSYPVSTNTYYSTKSHSFEHYSYFNNNGFYALNDGCTLCMSSIYTVYITKNNDKFTYTLNPDLKAEIYRTDDNKYYRWGQCYSQTKAPYYNNGPVIFGILDDYSPYWGKFVPPYTFTTNNSGTDYSKLHDLFRNLKDHARNVNLFVDGECWALASR